MGEKAESDDGRIRTAEAVASACLATDLGMGFPFEHGLHTTLTAMRLAGHLGVGRQVASQTYYACLLTYAGCTTDASESARIFGQSLTANVAPVEHGSPTERLAGVFRALPPAGTSKLRHAYEVLRRLPAAARFPRPHYAALCEVASMLAARLGLPPVVSDLFAYMTERWDGNGVLGRAAGEDIPLPIRIVHVARDATYQRVLGGDEHAARVIRDRAGHAFDPEIANLCADRAGTVMGDADTPGSVWDAVLAAEPRPWPELQPDEVDRALAAIGDFADLVSPWLSGHSQAVADLADKAARAAGFDDADVREVRRASHVHDLGRVAVHPGVWAKPGPLTADEWEQVRLHPYHTERVLAACPALAHLGAIAGAHHERLDGSGYHRGISGGLLVPAVRLIAAADAFCAMTEPRAHRQPLAPEQAAETLAAEAEAGGLDPELVAAVIDAAGQSVPTIQRPSGLTAREAEVVGLLARGLTTKQVAAALDISVKTVDNHIQNAYRKMGVSSRAAATLFAMEHGLVPWGELPIPSPDEAP